MTEAETDVRPGTYLTVVRPHQLKRGDIYTERLGRDATRDVVIEKVTYGEIFYRGMLVPVLFVYGNDDRLKKRVIYTMTSWKFLEIVRAGEPPQFRQSRPRVLGVATPEPFVY